MNGLFKHNTFKCRCCLVHKLRYELLITTCYYTAAEVYAKANLFSECLNVCVEGKLFDVGFEYFHYRLSVVDRVCLIRHTPSRLTQ